MAQAAAALRDEGGLPAEASLVFTQLLLNLVGHAGRAGGLSLIAQFLDAADVSWQYDQGAATLVVRDIPACTNCGRVGHLAENCETS